MLDVLNAYIFGTANSKQLSDKSLWPQELNKVIYISNYTL